MKNVALAVDHYGLNKSASRDGNYALLRDQIITVLNQILAQRQRLYSVPPRRVHTFVHRARLAETMRTKIERQQDRGPVPHALVLHGPGGTGKTQLALDFVEERRAVYDPVLWIDAQDQETARASFERCARDLGIEVSREADHGAAVTDAAAVRAVVRELQRRTESHDAWLVVLDNTDDVEWGVKRIIPHGQRGTVIITSRDNQAKRLLDGACEEVEVDVMEPVEANRLLVAHVTTHTQVTSEALAQGCDAIAAELGYLALALDLAGAYLSNEADKEQAVREYQTNLVYHRDELLQNSEFCGLQETDKTIWTVWDTTLAKIGGRSQEARSDFLLAFLSRFKGAVVQEEVFRLASGSINRAVADVDDLVSRFPTWLLRLLERNSGEWDSFHLRTALKPLLRYHLVRKAGGEWGGVTIHSLVQWRARRYRPSEPWDRWFVVFAVAVCHQLAQEEGTPQFRRHFLPHLSDAILSKESGLDDDRRAIVQTALARLYYSEGRWTEAEQLEVQVMETRKRVLGDEHPDTLTSMANLASTYRNQGRWAEAEQLEVQVMEMRKRVQGDEHPDTLTSMANLAWTLKYQQRLDEAIALLRDCATLCVRKLGNNHPDTVSRVKTLQLWEERVSLEH